MQLRRNRPLMIWAILVTGVLAIVAYGPVWQVDYQSGWIGNKPSTFVTVWRLARSRSRSLVIVSISDTHHGEHVKRVSGQRFQKLNRYGIYSNGRIVKNWRQPSIVLIRQAGYVMDSVPCDEQRLEWLLGDDPKTDAAEISRLDADCEAILAGASSRGQELKPEP